MDGRITAALPYILNTADGEVRHSLEFVRNIMSKNTKLAAILGAVALFFFVAIMVIQSTHY